MKTRKKEDLYYGKQCYAEVGNTHLAQTIGHRLSVSEAIKLRDALSRAIARCELTPNVPEIPMLNMIVLTTHKKQGRITVLAKRRIKPLRRGVAK